MTEAKLLLVVIGMGAVTYALRVGSLLLAERLPRSVWLGSFLKFVPVAVLSAIVGLVVLIQGGVLALSPIANPRVPAAVIAILVAWRTRSMLPTIAVGMIALWVLKAVHF